MASLEGEFMSQRFATSLTAVIVTFAFSTGLASGAGGGGVDHSAPGKPLNPAPRYDGSAPIDMSHGMLGSNGTFGAPNAEYEAKREAELAAPGVFAAPYPYSAKQHFITGLGDRLRFFEEAVVNLKERGTMVTPETNAFSDSAGPKIEEMLTRARDAFKKAKGAGEKDWVGAEQAARASFVEMKTAYEAMMRQTGAATAKQ